MATRKNITEVALAFNSRHLLQLHPADIRNIEKQGGEAAKAANKCHTYIIAKRPRLSFKPDSIKIANGHFVGVMRYPIEGVHREFIIEINNAHIFKSGEVSKYPHAHAILTRQNDTKFTLPAHLMPNICTSISDSSIFDLKVMYIGMAYGNGNRTAQERLLSHSTLQKVLADLNATDPDSEAVIILLSFDRPQTLISFDYRNLDPERGEDRDVSELIRKQRETLSHKEEIALIEAALINYFKPEYNEKMKGTFPNEGLSILKSIYEMDFGAISVELDSETLKARFFSDTCPCGYIHHASYDLHDTDVRESFFQFGSGKKTTAKNYTGPIC